MLFTGQTTTTQRGPWEIVSQGTTSPATSTVLRRPSWFSGTAKPFIGLIRNGSAYYGFAFLTYGMNGDIIVGTTVPSSVALSSRAASATTGTNTFSGSQTFRSTATGPSACPFSFSAATALMTTPQAHAVEWDNAQMYVTNSAAERLPVATSKVQINAQTGTTYTLVLADAGYLVTASNAGAITLSVPTNASVAFPIGTQILVNQLGAGQVTVAAVTSGTTTVSGRNGLKTSGQYAMISLVKVAADQWIVSGDTTA